MIKLLVDKIPRIIKNRKRLEKVLEVKITNKGQEVSIKGTGENEFIAEQVIKALDIGFAYPRAIKIKKDDLVFEILNIKDYTSKKNLEVVRGRIIGTKGKALEQISQLTNCALELKNNEIGIIGNPEEIFEAREAIIQLIQGSKHGNVYKGIIKKKKQEPKDLGLKDKE